MFKMIKYSLSLFLFLISACQKTNEKPDWHSLIAESLHQSIALEKLPDVGALLNHDTIFVYYDRSSSFSTNDIPSHVDKWTIKIIDSNIIVSIAIILRFDYLKLYSQSANNTASITTAKFTKYPRDSTFVQIDHGMLTSNFVISEDGWKLKDVQRWWGGDRGISK